MTKDIFRSFIIYIICETDYNSERFQTALKCLKKLCLKPKFKKLNIFLGDILDKDIYGVDDYHHLEDRLRCYSMSESRERLICMYHHFFLNLTNMQVKEKLDKKIEELFSKSHTLSMFDLFYIREYSLDGGKANLLEILDLDINKLIKEQNIINKNNDYADIVDEMIITIDVSLKISI